MINKKRIFLISVISVVTISSVIAIASSCTNEQNPEEKKPINKQNNKANSISQNKITFDVSLSSNVLKYLSPKHNLTLVVSSQYAKKFIEVELQHRVSNTSAMSNKSSKAKIDTKGTAIVVFSGLEQNTEYFISKINIYNNQKDENPIASNVYKTPKLFVNTSFNNQPLDNKGSSNHRLEPDHQNGSNNKPEFAPNFDPNANLGALLEHIKKQNQLKEQKASKRPISKQIPELKISEEKAYEKIKNRSFAIGFNSVDYALENDSGINKKNDSIIPFEPTGTGWLLDYAWKNNNKNSGELMLYIATNAHVYNRAFNAMKNDEVHKQQFPEYFTQESQKDARIDSFILAVPKKEANLNSIPSGESYGEQNNLEYFINTKKDTSKFDSDIASKTITFDEDKVFENPKTVFVALNIFDDKNNDMLVDKVNNNAQRKYSGKDFAVFGVKVNYNKLQEKAKSNVKYNSLLEHINNAIKSIDDDIIKFKKDKHPNHNQGDVPYLSLDYPSMWIDEEKPESEKLNKIKYNIDANTSLNVERAYILGFPKIGNKQMLWRNYPKGSDIPQDAFTGASFFKGQPLDKVLDLNTKATGFGFNAFVDYSSIYFGASGSLVVNEYGLPIGIYSSVGKVDNEKDISKKGGFTFLVQVHNDPDKGPAHNLIDGSDSTKFPHQKKSYRQNLRWLSKQSDSEFKDFAKTAIFKEGA